MRDILERRYRVLLPGAVTSAFMAILLVSSLLYAQSNEVVIMKVVLNAEDKGEYFFLLFDEKNPSFKVEDLKEMGLIGIFRYGAEELETGGYLSLKSLFPRVRFEIDWKASTLYIVADPELFENNVYDLGYYPPQKVQRTQSGSAFLNYSIRYSLDEDLEYTSLALPLEVGSNIAGNLYFSSFSYARSGTEDKFVRLNSRITVDDSSIYSRLIMGDFSAASGELGSGGSYGGLSFSSSFATEPFFITSSVVNLTFTVESPSDVEIYVNDLLVERRKLLPGEYTFSNLPKASGSGVVTVVIKDAYGGTRKFEKNFFTSHGLLKPGIQEFSYNIGLEREQFGQESFDYGEETTFLANHRFGISNYLTAGFRLEADTDVLNGGSMVDFVLGKIGVFRLAVAGSYAEKEDGYAGSLGYTYSETGFNFRLSGRGFTRDYATLSLMPFQDRPRLVTSVGFGYNFPTFGSFSATYSRSDSYGGTDTEATNFFYSKRLFNSLSFYASAGRSVGEDVEDQISLNLSFNLGGSKSVGLSRSMRESDTSDAFSLQKNRSPGPGGFGYGLRANRDEDDLGQVQTRGNASIQYNGSYGIYSTDYYRNEAVESYDLSASGAISIIDGSLHLSRPITDSFALVKVGQLENVKVSSGNQYVGKTSSRGKLLVPDLISYSNNLLSIGDKDIPINYEIEGVEKYVSTPLRGGAVVEFDILRLQGFGGYLFFIDKGERIPAEFAGLEIRVEEDLIRTVVGRNGEFYLENIPSGKWPARVYLGERWCSFDMVFPESDDIILDMGEFGCEVD
jgi:outer membrane usher protein